MPQWTISRDDLGSDNIRSHHKGRLRYLSFFYFSLFPSTMFSVVMKRFSKEELLVPRKSSVELEENSYAYPDIISVVPLEPVCTLSFDIEEVKQCKNFHKYNLLNLSCLPSY